MRLEDISQDEWIAGGLAVLLALDLLFLPWWSFGIPSAAISISSTATGAPDGWLGVLALLAVLILLADLVLARVSPQTQLPAVRGSRAATRVALAGAAAALLAFKLLLHLDSAGGFGFWLAVLLSGGLVYVTRRMQRLESVPR